MDIGLNWDVTMSQKNWHFLVGEECEDSQLGRVQKQFGLSLAWPCSDGLITLVCLMREHPRRYAIKCRCCDFLPKPRFLRTFRVKSHRVASLFDANSSMQQIEEDRGAVWVKDIAGWHFA